MVQASLPAFWVPSPKETRQGRRVYGIGSLENVVSPPRAQIVPTAEMEARSAHRTAAPRCRYGRAAMTRLVA